MINPPRESTLIEPEGVGSEVLVVFGVLGVFGVGVFLFYLVRMITTLRQPQPAHPEQLELMADVRRGMARDERRPEMAGGCPICLGDCACPIETVCGHVFCGTCWIALWNHRRRRVVDCPCCRRRVDLIVPVMTAAEANSVAGRGVVGEVGAYNAQNGGRNRSLVQQVSLLLPAGDSVTDA